MSNTNDILNCLIIGSGPAGYTAAIYAARANLSPVMVTGMQPGGQLTTTTDVENYPGYPKGVNGTVMMDDFKAQAERFGTKIITGQVTKVDFSGAVHQVWVDDNQTLKAHTVILSTGATAKYLGLASEQKFLQNGAGVSACAVCDGFFYRGKEVAIVGAGDTACEEAIYLSKLCTTVHMLVRSDKMRASKIMQQRVLDQPNIKVYWNSQTDELLGTDAVEGVRIKNSKTGDTNDIPIYGFFVAIGHQPNSAVFKDFVNVDEQGYVITKADSTQTNVEGVFASGDLQDKMYRQAVTAAGTGCMAALEAERYLSTKGLH